MIILFNILPITFLGLAACRQLERTMGNIVYWGLAVKLLGAFALGVVYHYVWDGGDTVALHQAIVQHNARYALSLSQYFHGLFSPIDLMSGNPRSVFFTRIMSPIGWLTGHNYWLMAGYLAVFSFWCTWRFIDTLIGQYPLTRWACVIGLGFLPSFIFWSSGLLKDTLANACACYVAATVLSSLWSRRVIWPQVPIAVGLFLVLIFTRHYLAGMVFLTLSLAVAGELLSHRSIAARFVLLSLVFIVGAMSFRYFYIRLRADRLPLTVYEIHEEVRAKSKQGDVVGFGLQPTWSSLLLNAPRALISGLFRPWPWEARTFFSALQSFENVTMLALCLVTLRYSRRIRWDPVVLAAVIYVVMLATLLTLVTPNFGSLSRYKAGFSTYLFILIAAIPFQRLFENKRQIN